MLIRNTRLAARAAALAAATALVVLASGGWIASQWPEQVASGPAADFASPDPQSPWLPE